MWRQQFQGSILLFSLSLANQKRHCSSNSHRSNILSLSIRILSAELAWNRTQVKASGFACMQESESVFNLCELHIKLHPFPHVHLLSLNSAQWASVVTPALCRHLWVLKKMLLFRFAAVVLLLLASVLVDWVKSGEARPRNRPEPFPKGEKHVHGTVPEPFPPMKMRKNPRNPCWELCRELCWELCWNQCWNLCWKLCWNPCWNLCENKGQNQTNVPTYQ